MSIANHKQWIVFAVLVVCLMIALFYSGPTVFGMLFGTGPQASEPVIDRLPVVDEDPVSAAQPLSKVLNGDFMHDGNSYVRFDDSVRSRLRHRQFADLDQFAEDLRKTKLRLPGGGWRLYRFYGQLAEPAAGRKTPGDEWEAHFKLLREWTMSYPDSITARVAYADALVTYAWLARGGDYADKVSSKQWALFKERLGQAEQVLRESYKLQTRCPHWYAVMQNVALGQGWGVNDYDQLVDEAIRSEPLYLAYYSGKAEFLLPRWYGDDGDSEKFVREAADRVGGTEGSVIYYYVFSYLTRFYKDDGRFESKVSASWPRLKQGFVDLDRLYHVTYSTVNLHAKMAYAAGDKNEARVAFERIDINWDEGVWDSREKFESAKTWAAPLVPAADRKVGVISRP